MVAIPPLTTIFEDLSLTTSSEECFQDWVGDGCCDDIYNIQECNYDGGDCCGSNINTNCCDECLCLNDDGNITTTTLSLTTSSEECFQDWVGDGYCDDIYNIQECNYDDGDCCGSNINFDYCDECQCLETEGIISITTTTTPSLTLIVMKAIVGFQFSIFFRFPLFNIIEDQNIKNLEL